MCLCPSFEFQVLEYNSSALSPGAVVALFLQLETLEKRQGTLKSGRAKARLNFGQTHAILGVCSEQC